MKERKISVLPDKLDSQFLVTQELLEPILPLVIFDKAVREKIETTVDQVEKDRKIGRACLWLSRLGSAVTTKLLGSEDLSSLAWPIIVSSGVTAAATVLAFHQFNHNQRRVEGVADRISSGLQAREDLAVNPEVQSLVETLKTRIGDLANAERAVGCSPAELNTYFLAYNAVFMWSGPEIWQSILAMTGLGLGQINLFHNIYAEHEKKFQELRTRVRDLAHFGRSDPQLTQDLDNQREETVLSTDLVTGVSKLTSGLPLVQAVGQLITTGSSPALLPALVEPIRAALSSEGPVGDLMSGVVGMNWLRMKGQLARNNLLELRASIPEFLPMLSSQADWDDFRKNEEPIQFEPPDWARLKRFLILEDFNPVRLDTGRKLFTGPVNMALRIDKGIIFVRSPSGLGKSTVMRALTGRSRFSGEIGLRTFKRIEPVKDYSINQRDTRLMAIQCDRVLPEERKMLAIDLYLQKETGFRQQLSLLVDDYRLTAGQKLAKAAENFELTEAELEGFLRLSAKEKTIRCLDNPTLGRVWYEIKIGLIDWLESNFGNKRAREVEGGYSIHRETEFGRNVLLKSCQFFKPEEKVDRLLFKSLEACSSGQLARFKLALAYYSGARFLVIDEPLSNIQYSEEDESDYQHMIRVLKMMANRIGVVVISQADPDIIVQRFGAMTGALLELDKEGLRLKAEKISEEEGRVLAGGLRQEMAKMSGKELDLVEKIQKVDSILEPVLGRMGQLSGVAEFHWNDGDHQRWLKERDNLRKILDSIVLKMEFKLDQVFKNGVVATKEEAKELRLISDFARKLEGWGVAQIRSLSMVKFLREEGWLQDWVSYEGGWGEGRNDWEAFVGWLRHVQDEWDK